MGMLFLLRLRVALLTECFLFQTPNLAHYTTFSEEEILPTANIMLEYILTNPIQHESLYKKFSSRRYFRVRRRPLFLFVSIILTFWSMAG